MTYDTKNMRRAQAKHEELIASHESALIKRRAKIRGEIPRLAEIDKLLRTSVIGAIHTALRRDENAEDKILAIRDENLELQREQAELLTANGYPYNYLSDVPMCDECNDTGFVDGKMCSCFAKLYAAEQRRELSQSLNVEKTTFDKFKFDCYDSCIDPKLGVSAADNMAYIYDTCVDFAQNFSKHSDNLLLQGASGIGKTFLAGCIANTVIDSGASVLYESAPSLFAQIESDRFRREDDAPLIDFDRFLVCDLFILDDLGTEAMTNYGVTMLYRLINSRSTNGKKTIVITGLSSEDIRRRYGPQIASRLEGEYTSLRFFGEDVRKLLR